MSLSDAERDVMLHAVLGGERKVYRNYFNVGPGCQDYDTWQALCSRGMAYSHGVGDQTYFHVTPEGFPLLNLKPHQRPMRTLRENGLFRKDWPILFSASMVLALLAGRKTQTRRLATSPLSKAQRGDRMWAREHVTMQTVSTDHKCRVIYEASRLRAGSEAIDWVTIPPDVDPYKVKIGSRPSIHMPRWACRVTREIAGARIEALQKISDADCLAEGPEVREELSHIDGGPMVYTDRPGLYATPRAWYRTLWDQLHPKTPWDSNPDVVVLTFREVPKPFELTP